MSFYFKFIFYLCLIAVQKYNCFKNIDLVLRHFALYVNMVFQHDLLSMLDSRYPDFSHVSSEFLRHFSQERDPGRKIYCLSVLPQYAYNVTSAKIFDYISFYNKTP